MKRKTFLVALLAIVLIFSASIQPAMAYFSAYTTASGGQKVTVSEGPDAYEREKNMVKTLVITNKKGAAPIFVRAKVVYSPTKAEVKVTDESSGKWVLQGDYYYYTELVPGGSETEPLQVKIKVTQKSDEQGNPIEPLEGDEFNVIVQYESTLALYNDEGTDYVTWDQADWSRTLDVVTDEP